MAGETLPVCAASALPPRTRRVIDHDGLKLVVLNCAGELFAIEDCCSTRRAAGSNARATGRALTCVAGGR